MRKCRAFTLFELLIILVLLSFMLALAVPGISQSLQRNAVYSDSKELLHLVNLARQQAVYGGVRVVICAVDSMQRCTRGWSRDLLVFTDANHNNRLDHTERVLHHWQHDNRHSRLQWQGFGPGFLRFRESGYAAENGAFTLCPVNGDSRLARQLVINRVGRAYITRDRDGDGVVEYGDDREPAC